MPLAARVVAGCAGVVLVAAGFLVGVYASGLTALPPHRRPRFASGAAYRLGWNPARLALMAAGILAALAAHPLLAVILAAGLAGAWVRRLQVRSLGFQKRLLRAAYVELCRRDPRTPRDELLAHLIQSRHPRWDPELVRRIVADHTTVDGALDSLVRLERRLSG